VKSAIPLRSRALARLTLAAAAVLWLAPILMLGAPAQATTVERVVSPGGIEAWLVREPAVPLIAVEFAFVGGSAQDAPGKGGTATLLAALLGEAAGDFDANAFTDRLERKAVELNFAASRELISGSLRTLSENRDEAFDDLRLALTAPRFDQPDVEVDRAQMMSQLRRQTTSPTSLASKRWWETAFAGHPYGRPVNGTAASVPTITVDDMKAYAHRVLARDHLKIAIVGDIDAATAARMLDHVFGALPAQAQLTPVGPAVPQSLGQRIDVNLDVPQTVINFGGVGIARDDPDFMAAYLVNHILGGGSSDSRLYQEVRETRGLVYSIYDNLVWLDHAAVFYGATATRADSAGATLDLVEQQIRKLAETGPTSAELAKAKAYIDSSFALSLDTSGKIASLLVQEQLDHLSIDYFKQRSQMIAAVTLEDARRAAKRLFEGGLLVTVVGRPSGLISSAGGPSGAPAAAPVLGNGGGGAGAPGELR
jgi:zinc protease